MGWWSDWWDSIAQSFGYEAWVWGSAGEWAAAIFTGATLFLLIREALRVRYRERNSQGESFFTGNEEDETVPEVEGVARGVFLVHNPSDKSIYDFTVYEDGSNFEEIPLFDWWGVKSHLKRIVGPGETHEYRWPSNTPGQNDSAPKVVRFVDHNGIVWERRWGFMVMTPGNVQLPRKQQKAYLLRKWRRHLRKMFLKEFARHPAQTWKSRETIFAHLRGQTPPRHPGQDEGV